MLKSAHLFAARARVERADNLVKQLRIELFRKVEESLAIGDCQIIQNPEQENEENGQTSMVATRG
jgi:hypothetical protein